MFVAAMSISKFIFAMFISKLIVLEVHFHRSNVHLKVGDGLLSQKAWSFEAASISGSFPQLEQLSSSPSLSPINIIMNSIIVTNIIVITIIITDIIISSIIITNVIIITISVKKDLNLMKVFFVITITKNMMTLLFSQPLELSTAREIILVSNLFTLKRGWFWFHLRWRLWGWK